MTNISIFKPASVGALNLKNRIAMAPMTRSRADERRVPKPIVADYYAQRSGAGLIISEGVGTSPTSFGFPSVPGIFSDEQLQGWRVVTDALKGTNALFFMQLWHVGRVSHPDNLPPGAIPVAPSAISAGRDVMTSGGLKPSVVPHELKTDEVWGLIREYVNAAKQAVAAGCDGVEIHAANGYLPAQFLHETTNHRQDEWGGSIKNRARFVIEIARACAEEIGKDRVGVRISPFSAYNGASSSDEALLYEHLIQELSKIDLAYLHVVTMEVSGHLTRQEGDSLVPDVVGFTRKFWSGVLVAAGGYNLAKAEADLNTGRADIIAFGRDFIANPDLPDRLAKGLPMEERRMSDWYGSDAKGYTDYVPWSSTGRI